MYMLSSVVSWLGGMGSLPLLLLIDFSIQWIGWAVACLLHTERFYDLTGSSTFIIVTCLCYFWNSTGHIRQTLLCMAVMLWAFRLGTFLFLRIMSSGRDRRFDKTRDYPVRFFVAWTLQGVWVIMTLLPTLLCTMSHHQPPLGVKDYAGLVTFLVGFTIEVLADKQKTVFRRDSANKNKFISSGLWSVSRHPNYFGEILLWYGLWISASSTFVTWEWITLACPTLVYLLITRVSGIPMLEIYANKKWGNTPQYKAYVSNTALLVPYC